ncbi:hypothetical protein TKK_0017047 [Trichogramma kaykai]
MSQKPSNNQFKNQVERRKKEVKQHSDFMSSWLSKASSNSSKDTSVLKSSNDYVSVQDGTKLNDFTTISDDRYDLSSERYDDETTKERSETTPSFSLAVLMKTQTLQITKL